jgi:hypothetical protein
MSNVGVEIDNYRSVGILPVPCQNLISGANNREYIARLSPPDSSRLM